MKHINSERNIINSEHDKNILNDFWITDDLVKHFFDKNSPYNKFGTGNSESLKNITKEDILKFYNKYYTTDNISVCIIDSKPIDYMIDNFIPFFDDIAESYDNDRFVKQKLNLIENNLIEFKSISEHNLLNILLFIECNKNNQIEYQLANLISEIIGQEYITSLSYYLKENFIVKNLNSGVDYFYDYNALINIRFILNNKNDINLISNLFNDFLNNLLEISENDFIKIYNNFIIINKLKYIYEDDYNPIDASIEIVQNLLKHDTNLAILYKFVVPEYKKDIFNKFIKMINSIKIKLITNTSFENKTKHMTTKWYNTKYKILNFKLKEEKIKHDFKIINMIGIDNTIIKINTVNFDNDKDLLPKLVYKNDELKRKVYLLEYNKYSKPISNISIIRKNSLLLDKKNKIIMYIYKNICADIINYYIETMKNYKLFFDFSINNEFIVWNFYGINYLINNYMFNIIKLIHPDTIFNNNKTKIYFDKNISDIKELLKNNKYNSPFNLCREYQNLLLTNDILPNEQLEYIDNIDFEYFKNIVQKCIKYEFETFIIIGIKNNKNIKYIIDSLSLDIKRYLINDNFKQENVKSILKYTFNKDEINPNENNNCIIKNFLVNEINISAIIICRCTS
jgi:insulysin